MPAPNAAAGTNARLKRKVASPAGKPPAKRAGGVAATRAAPSGGGASTRQAPAGSVSTTRAAPSASVAAPPPAADGSAGPPADGSGWEEVAAETGWTPADCLAHKLSFGKRADAKSKVDALVAHVKRLRSAGWHLHEARDAAAADAADAAERADAEAALRRSDRETSDLALREVQRELGSLAQAARAHETQQAQRQAEVG